MRFHPRLAIFSTPVSDPDIELATAIYISRLAKKDGLAGANLCAATALEQWLETVGNKGPAFSTFDCVAG